LAKGGSGGFFENNFLHKISPNPSFPQRGSEELPTNGNNKMRKLETGISETELSKISELIAERTGLHFPVSRWHDLERGICSAAREFGFKDAESCIRWLLSSSLSKTQIEVLASYLTVGETYFFRENKTFEMLEKHILPELIHSRQGNEKNLRIWSAGCCTGEEPYSIAILLNKIIPDIKNWNITILATDINPRFLQKASAGSYKEWSFRNPPSALKERYFKKTKQGRFEILLHIKKLVTFFYLNLMEDIYPSLLNNTNAMDIIFCRNVLMYFAHEHQRKVIENLYRCLLDGGWLIVSPSEISHVLFARFTAVNFQGVTVYRKTVSSDKLQVSGFRMQDAIPKFQNASHKLQVANDKIQEIIPPAMDFTTLPESKIIRPEEPLHLEAGVPKAEEIHADSYKEALALFEQGCFTEATEKIAELLSMKKDDTKAMALMARAYANQGHLSEAHEWCEKAIVADKLNPGCHYLLATILQERGQTEEAVASLKRTIYLEPDFVLAHFSLGNLTKQQSKLKESEKHFENALTLLHDYRNDEILPESEGVTAGRLKEIIKSTVMEETFA
jgi:chemotaxis protein methyltransferase CheR